MTQHIKVERLSPELKAEVQRLWDIYVQDTGYMTFDEWLISTQIAPLKKEIAAAAQRMVGGDKTVFPGMER
nr:hypothetical protein HUO10_003312 [Paraburkholderia busanensis]